MALPRSRPLDGPIARLCGAASDVAAGRRVGRPGIGPAPSGRGRRRAAQYAPRCCRSRGARRAASRWSRIGSAPVSRQATGSAGPSRRRGGDSNLSSGISSREGGISTAIEARVDEAILYLQSGHGHALPARAYMHLTPPDRFLEIPEALGLCLAAAIEISSLAASAACWRWGHCHG